MAMTNDEIMAKVNEMKNKVKNRALSDSDMANVTGGTGEQDAEPKFNVGDQVHVADLEELGIGEIVAVNPFYGLYFYDVRFSVGTYSIPEEDIYC